MLVIWIGNAASSCCTSFYDVSSFLTILLRSISNPDLEEELVLNLTILVNTRKNRYNVCIFKTREFQLKTRSVLVDEWCLAWSIKIRFIWNRMFKSSKIVNT